jgi:TrmH family RNA methyltransferase
MITSSHNPRIQKIRDLLNNRRDRTQRQVFVLEGVRLLEEAVQAGWPLEQVYYTNTLSERGRRLLDECAQKGIPIEDVHPSIMDSLSDTETSQGLLAVAGMKELPVRKQPDFLLIADAVRDPGNLGTLLRTAAAAGVDLALLTPGTADAYNPKVLRAAMGAHFHLPIICASWEEIEPRYKQGRQFFLAEMETKQSIWEADFRQPLAIIIGGEAEGAGDEARKLADQTIKIRMAGVTESLNAAVAAGIILFEVVRQRNP